MEYKYFKLKDDERIFRLTHLNEFKIPLFIFSVVSLFLLCLLIQQIILRQVNENLGSIIVVSVAYALILSCFIINCVQRCV